MVREEVRVAEDKKGQQHSPILVNDVFVMKAWKKDLKANNKVLLLSDSNGTFTKAIEQKIDLSDKPVGLNIRSKHYALLALDGVGDFFNPEDGLPSLSVEFPISCSIG